MSAHGDQQAAPQSSGGLLYLSSAPTASGLKLTFAQVLLGQHPFELNV